MFTHLTDDQWQKIEPLLPTLPVRADGKGRRWKDSRAVLDGILWVLHTGAPWGALPKAEYPPYQTCHRRFRRWIKDGTLLDQGRHLAGSRTAPCWIKDGTLLDQGRHLEGSGSCLRPASGP